MKRSHFAVGFRVLASGSAIAIALSAVSAQAADADKAAEATADAVATQNADAAKSADQPQGTREIVVTAQRREQRLTEVPVSVQAIGSETLERAAISSANEIITLTPSVNFTSGFAPNATSVAIRGVASISQEGGVQPSTAVVVDDVAYYNQGEFVSDFADIERVEVLRGPQGTLFGKNATAGVINIINKKPVDYYEGSFEAGYTTDNERLLRGIANIPLADNIALRINAYNKDRDFLYENRSPIIRSNRYAGGLSEESWGFAGKLKFDFSPSASFLLSADYSENEGTGGAAVITMASTVPALAEAQAEAGVIASRSDPFTNSDAPNYYESTRFGISGALELELSDTLSLKSITAYREFDYDSYTNADGGPWGGWNGVGLLPETYDTPVYYLMTSDDGIPRAPVGMDYFSQELRFGYVSGPLDVVFGGYMQKFSSQGANSVPFIFVNFGNAYINNDLDYDISDDIYSVFADATFELSDIFSVFGGLRYTHENFGVVYNKRSYFTTDWDPVTLEPNGAPTVTAIDESDTKNNLSGRIGVRLAPNRDHSYYASYSRGYKGPAINVSRTATPDNVFLEPEIANAFEVGTKHNFGVLRADLALFYQTISDVQQSAVIPGTASTELQNTGKIRSYGAELDMSGQVSDAFSIDGGVSYVHATYQDFVNSCYPGQTAAQGCINGQQDLDSTMTQGAPRFAARIGGTYDIDTGASLPFDAFVKLSYSYQSSVQHGLTNDPLLREPGHSLVDATIGLTGKEDGWQLLFYGRNLTNEIYFQKLVEANGVIGRQSGSLPRNFKRYGGIMLKISR